MTSLIIFLPLIVALLLPLFPSHLKRYVAASGAALTLALLLGVWADGGAVFYRSDWFMPIGLTYSVTLTGTSLLLAMVTAFMSLCAVLYAGVRIEKPSAMLLLTLCMETGLLGIFAARDLLLFYIFFEATLLPSMLMLAFYGGEKRLRAITKFAIYTIVGSLFLLASIIGVRVYGGAPSFAFSDLLEHPLPKAVQPWLFSGFLAAFLVKLPLFPVHGWLADFHEQNHESGIPDLMGTLYKVGGYGLLQFALPLCPWAAMEWKIPLMALAAFTAIYAAWIAFQQTHWKRLLAYAGLSHMGMVGLGVLSLNITAQTGAMYLLAFQGVYMGALFLAADMLQRRTGSFDVRQGGIADSAPRMSGMTMVLWFAAIGVPGLAGFIGEFSILLGAYQVSPWLAGIAGLATIAAAAYALTAFQHSFWEKAPNPVLASVKDLSAFEMNILLWSAAVLVFFGIYSQPALRLIQGGG